MIRTEFHEHVDLTVCVAEGATIESSETSEDGYLVYDYDAGGWLVQVTVRSPSSAKARRTPEPGNPEPGNPESQA